MKDQKPVPPALAEFAIGERAELLATIARYEATAENCEVLRARLAKYEDAQGVPVATIAEQATEIERLQLTCNDLDDQNDRIYAELAALKAQPSVVVLPPRMSAFSDDFPERHTAARWFNQALDEVARLNSSPVSAGESFCEYCGGNDEEPQDHCMDCTRPVSAGGVDDRAAFQEWYATPEAFKAGDSNGWRGIAWAAWQKRAALSAPSHGEQVREWCEGVEAAVNLIDKKAEDYAMEHGHDDMGGLSFGTGQHAQIKADYHSSLIELAAEVLGLIEAAPLAGSQEKG